MSRPFRKEAAGELTARFARWLSTPIPGTPKLIQKVRTGPELDLLEQGIRDRAKKHVEDPIRSGLTRIGAHKALGGAARAAAPVVKRDLPVAARREWAQEAGKKAVDFIARKPHLALAHSPLIPIPGTGLAAEGVEALKNRFLNSTPGLKVKTAWQDSLPGGLADKKTPSDFSPRQLKKGRKVELEHVNNKNLATEITMDHLTEDPRYYDKLQKMEKTAQVSPYQQSTQWTCSAACLKAVLAHYGVEIPEELAVRAIGTRPNRGAECNEIMWAAHKFGFDAFEYSFDSLDQAKILTDADIPIIADIQSFNNPGKGHYVVITAIAEDGVHLMDPNTPGNQRFISREEMDERWWDRAMAPPHELMPKWGIVVLPPEDA